MEQEIQWQFAFQVAGQAESLFQVRRFVGNESVSQSHISLEQSPYGLLQPQRPCYGFCYQIDLLSEQFDLSLADFVEQSATLILRQDGEIKQYVNGVIAQCLVGATGDRYRHYAVLLVPAFERLSLRHNMRIFQQKNAQQIIATILAEMGVQHYQFAIQGTPATREFCVQYRETDLDFVQRLAAEEGWSYHFEHQCGQHNLLFTDSSQGFARQPEACCYYPYGAGVADRPYIDTFAETATHQTSDTSLKDYSFKTPSSPLLCKGKGEQAGGSYEYYDWGRHKNAGTGGRHSQHQLQYLQRESHTAYGRSNQPLMRAGMQVTITDVFAQSLPDSPQASRGWNIVQIQHRGAQAFAYAGADQTDETLGYRNQFKVIPAAKNWRSAVLTKPQVHGVTLGKVVGPPGEEIYCDEHGRVKVHFLWDRDSKQDDSSSCWIRVSQGWAGEKHGALALPRVGDEVLISFLYDDPDQPMITGRAYHAQNKPPRSLPDNKTQTVLFKTSSYQGEGFNEFRIEDKAGAEEIYMHAQKDYQAKVLHDHATDIGHDKTLLVANDSIIAVKNDQTLTVDNDRKTHIKNDHTCVIGNDQQHQVKHDQQITVDNDYKLQVKNDHQLTVDNNHHTTVNKDKRLTVSNDFVTQVQHDQKITVDNDSHINVKNDQHVSVDNDQYLHVANDQHVVVGHDQYVSVAHDYHHKIDGQYSCQVDKDCSLISNGHLHQQAIKTYALDVGTEMHVQSAQHIVIEAVNKISFKVADTFLTLDADGIHFSSIDMSGNAGGEPGSGSGFAGAAPSAAQASEKV